MRLQLAILFLTMFLVPIGAIAQGDCPAVASGTNYAGKTMIDYNFTTLPANALVGANFSGAILNGAQFQNMNLTNANFSDAVMLPSAKGVTNLSGANLDHTCFQHARLDSANLQFATFKATDFSKASLFSSDFGPVMNVLQSSDGKRTKFNGTTTDFNHFPIKNWPPKTWAYTDLSDVRISGLTDDNFSFYGKDISWAILKGAILTHFDFRHCRMTGVDFTGANLDYALMDSSTMDQVTFIEGSANHAMMRAIKYYDAANTGKGANFSGTVFNNATMSRSDFSYANFQGATLLGVTADHCRFDNANFQSGNGYNVANFSGATLSYSTFSSAQLNGANFSNTYIVAGNFDNNTMNGTNFSYATMPSASFQGVTTLQGVLFPGAILQDARFVGTIMMSSPTTGSGVVLSCTQLGGADFTNATITQADFSDAVIAVADSCCKTLDGYHCGIIAINQLGYGATVLPALKNKINCPNGQYAQCEGTQWIIPGWKTANCNPQHFTETVWFKPNCGGEDTTGKITFADANLEACIVDELFGGDHSRIITRNIAAQVTSLSCPGRNISKLDGLQYFTALRELDLSFNHIQDGTFFSTIRETGKAGPLHTLKVANNQLVTLNLYHQSDLSFLDASHNQLTSVLIDASAYINFLDLSYNALTNMNISIQTDLNYLDLSHNKLSSIGNLSQLTEARSLYLENNSLTSIGDVSKLFDNGRGNLIYLLLSCNLPFECNTLGLNSTTTEKDFLSHTGCGVNSGPDCVK